jgi:hypothetical protein
MEQMLKKGMRIVKEELDKGERKFGLPIIWLIA